MQVLARGHWEGEREEDSGSGDGGGGADAVGDTADGDDDDTMGTGTVTRECASEASADASACCASSASSQPFKPAPATWRCVQSVATGAAIQAIVALPNGDVVTAGGIDAHGFTSLTAWRC